MSRTVARIYLDDALATFRDYKSLAEKAFAQIADEDFFHTLDAEANSIAIIIKHMSGNMLSRWTDFLTDDGEKPWRDRDAEFELNEDTTREELMHQWERGWACLFAAVEPLAEIDLERSVAIRGEPHSVVEALNRQLTHYAYHVGQIVLLAKHAKASEWKSLSVPKGKSKALRERMMAEQAQRRQAGDEPQTRRAESRLAPDPSLYDDTEKA